MIIIIIMKKTKEIHHVLPFKIVHCFNDFSHSGYRVLCHFGPLTRCRLVCGCHATTISNWTGAHKTTNALLMVIAAICTQSQMILLVSYYTTRQKNTLRIRLKEVSETTITQQQQQQELVEPFWNILCATHETH